MLLLRPAVASLPFDDPFLEESCVLLIFGIMTHSDPQPAIMLVVEMHTPLLIVVNPILISPWYTTYTIVLIGLHILKGPFTASVADSKAEQLFSPFVCSPTHGFASNADYARREDPP